MAKITLEQAKEKIRHSLNLKKEMVEAADERLLKWQQELETTGKVSFC